MFSTCNTACVGELTIAAATQCQIYQRNEVPVRLLVAKCDVDFPEGDYKDDELADAVAALIASGDIGATFELSQFAWQDPTTAEASYRARCRPPQIINTSRVLTARDYSATDVDPAGESSPFWDRTFYQNVLKNKGTSFRGFVTCDGKVYLFKNPNGTFASYSLHAWTGFDTEIDGTSIEFKNLALTFMGDPVNWTTPYLDIVAAGAIGSLGWLFQPV